MSGIAAMLSNTGKSSFKVHAQANCNLTSEYNMNEVILCDTFLYYLFAYDDALTCVECVSYVYEI